MLRIFLALLAAREWKCNCIDIKSAFLQGETLDREVYLKPPAEAVDTGGKLWKLKKCVYGLNDAARAWYFTVRSELLKLGCVQLQVDPALFYWYQDDKLAGLFVIHVDDFLWGGTKEFEEHVINEIRSKFDVGKEADCIFKYVGIETEQSAVGITVKQKSYLDSVDSIPLSLGRASRKYDNLNTQEAEKLRSLVGQLNWLCTQSRPDACYDVLEISSNLKHPVVEDILKANKCVKKLRNDECFITFPPLGDPNNLRLVAFSDASHANLSDGVSSAGGFIVFLVNGENQCCPLAWGSKKIRRVVKSTLAAESLAMVEAVDVCYYLAHILSEILFMNTKKVPIECYVDNHSLWDNVHSTKM